MLFFSKIFFITFPFFITFVSPLDTQISADNYVFQQETDNTGLNELVAIEVDMKSIPCGVVLTQELHGTTTREQLNESIFWQAFAKRAYNFLKQIFF